ncbi:NAD(P)/FAD-dependent oxidoreductase [Halapricum hydrolyticum]|uniref:FAD-dependent oxidoreductase n=1 Tax=Halapricum hydrolyticum TaxID=2979991 RepID=A0AAE3I8T7_9EURY|nr:FAD-dependent oxidoreductase [Halapricum hydrolyticum]MCU4716924.1 FAD-dependent oxidoreductase [Halapricum hydrolyticum]MCU4725471.1 FAD-dependent oxidoreductase [Halapricum hydrolyticum]
MRVAVFGGGYAGLPLVRRLERRLPATDEIVLFDDSPTHTVRHEVHRVIRRPDLAEAISIPFDDILGRAHHRQRRVADIDPERQVATLVDGETVDYDAGAISLGVETAFYGLEGVRDHATPLRTVEHAREIRAGAFEAFEEDGRIVVGGAGLSGIQVAGEIAALAAEHDVDATVTLLEQAHTIVPGFPADMRRGLHEELDARGIEVRTGVGVERADEATVGLEDGSETSYDQFIWTGGIRGTDAVPDRPAVPATLRLTDRTFALGDAARVTDVDGRVAPASAHTAIRQAPVVAENLAALLAFDREGGRGFEPRLDRYDYDQLGWLVSVGDGAVAKVGPQVLRGAAATAVKRSVGVGYLTSIGAVQDAVELLAEELR